MAEVRRYPVSGAGVGREDYAAPVLGPNAKEMRTESRSTTSNDSDIVDGQAPPNFRTGVTYEGKFYTRGCRGMIEQLQIYCIRTAAGTLTLRYSPHPCLGPIGEVIITPGVAWAWVAADIEEMWNYDSLFIWVHACSPDVSWAFDALLPLDGHESDDNGATWADLATRPFIRAVYTGETAGDVPISGIVNNIPIPNISSIFQQEGGPVTANIEAIIITVEGAGYCDYVEFHVFPSPNSHFTVLNIYCDGILSFARIFNWLNARGFLANTPTISLTEYGVNADCTMLVHKKFEFRREFRVAAFNALANQVVDGYAYPTLIR